MPIPELHSSKTAGAPRRRTQAVACCCLVALLLVSGCGKDVAEQASDSDANGYLCLKCNARLYAERSVFLGPTCPKCSQPALTEVVSYLCPADNHLTIRSRSDDRAGAACESCRKPVNGMRLPRENELKSWGATKHPS
jgi:hypothetical protein